MIYKKILFKVPFLVLAFLLYFSVDVDKVLAIYQPQYDFYNVYEQFNIYLDDDTNIFIENYSVGGFLDYLEGYIEENNLDNLDYSIYFSTTYNNRKQILVYIYNLENTIPIGVSYFLQSTSGSSATLFGLPTTNNNNSYSVFYLNSSQSIEVIQNTLSDIKDCLENKTTYSISGTFNGQLGGTYSIDDANVYISDESNNISIPYSSNFANAFYYNGSNSGSSIRYFRDLQIDATYKFDDFIPTFKDFNEESSYIPFSNFYGVFGKLTSTYDDDVISFSLSNDTSIDNIYVNNINFYTKVTNDNYITYNKIVCSFDSFVETDENTRTFKFNNFSCNNVDDGVYFNITVNNSYNIYNFKNNNSSVELYANDFVNSNSYIVDSLENLDPKTQILFSTNLSSTNLYYFYDTSMYSLTSRLVDLSNLRVLINGGYGRIVTSKLEPNFSGDFGLINNSGFIVYNTNLTSSNFSLNYVVNAPSTLISFSSLNNYYYYDSNKGISNSIITNDYFGSSSVQIEDDITNYFELVNGYILSISDDISLFKEQLQNFYNLAPAEVKNILLIFFICNMTYITFRILSK